MNILRVTDLENGHVRVSLHRGGSVDECPSPIPFVDPLTEEDRKELQWYLEDFLSFPYGAERFRAKQVEQKMQEWGESLFSQVLMKNDSEPDPYSLYTDAVRSGYRNCELCIASTDPAFLGIPWELVREPGPRGKYLANLLGGLYRCHTGQKIGPLLEVAPEESFRVLLAIARPYGERDVPLGTVARPVLDAIRPLRPRIELEVLRPPTFDELQRRLNERPGHYHLVHFDGHGDFAADAGVGLLIYENEEGGPDAVSSQDLGELLATSRVPLFVLNACRSATEGARDPFSSVAAQLAATGANGVVAMSYSVYTGTAAGFMGRFYENLVGHAPLAKAVTEGRHRLYANQSRDSVIGPIKLKDWVVPTLYQRESGYVPFRKSVAAPDADEDAAKKELLEHAKNACPEGRFGFIGRDYHILRVERALRDDNRPWVLLSGLGGIGKTELAFGFARWYAETGGCPGGVFMTSFKEKADFGQVIGSIVGFGTDFSRLPEDEQWKQLIHYVRENPCLLVWDNFEPVAGYPEGAEPLATDEEREKLSRFLKALKGGKTKVLITTRKPDEHWLGVAYKQVEVKGLVDRDAAQLAAVILSTVDRSPNKFKNDPDYSELIGLLKGHPRSLEIVLPHLKTKSPRDIIDAIQLRTSKLGEKLEDASLSYAFSQMSEKARKHLPFIGLFASYVYLPTLANFVAHGDEQQETYKQTVGKALDREGWEEILGEASRNGLIRAQSGGLYGLHPTLPAFLRKQLESMPTVGEKGLARLDSEFVKFYAAWAAHFHKKLEKADQHAVAAATVEEANLLRALRLTEMNDQWEAAQAIVQTLNEFYEIRGRSDEWNALRARLLRWVGREMSPDADRDRANLWMFLLGDEANDALSRNDLSTAEKAHQGVLKYLVDLNDPDVELKTAVAYHQLGMIAQERQQFGKAEEWYRKALEITERLGLERNAASDYHQLGSIALLQKQFSKAEEWYRKALETFERLDLEREAATVYHQLGMIAQKRRRFGEAEEWYRKALEIRERLGLEREAATVYHQLGMIAQERQQFDKAEEWYRKALEIFERLAHPPLLVNNLAQFGVLRRKQGRPVEAIQWFGKALSIATEYKMPVAEQIVGELARVMKSMGEESFVGAWRNSFEAKEPPLEILRKVAEIIEEREERAED